MDERAGYFWSISEHKGTMNWNIHWRHKGRPEHHEHMWLEYNVVISVIHGAVGGSWIYGNLSNPRMSMFTRVNIDIPQCSSYLWESGNVQVKHQRWKAGVYIYIWHEIWPLKIYHLKKNIFGHGTYIWKNTHMNYICGMLMDAPLPSLMTKGYHCVVVPSRAAENDRRSAGVRGGCRLVIGTSDSANVTVHKLGFRTRN